VASRRGKRGKPGKRGTAAGAKAPLAQIRAEINAVDELLQELLNRRALLAQQVAFQSTPMGTRSISTGRSARPRCCAPRSSATRTAP